MHGNVPSHVVIADGEALFKQLISVLMTPPIELHHNEQSECGNVILYLGFWWKYVSRSVFYVHRLCSKRQDRRALSEAKAKALIVEDYRKLGPIK